MQRFNIEVVQTEVRMPGNWLLRIILGVILFAPVSDAQDDTHDQMLIKAGYLLSAESTRLNLIKEKIAEIRRKKTVLYPENDPEIDQISMLISNLFWIETVCSYESMLLSLLPNVAKAEKVKYYQIQYSRLKNITLKKMYLNFKSTQSNFSKISDPEVRELAGAVKKELLRVLRLIEEEIDMLEIYINGAN